MQWFELGYYYYFFKASWKGGFLCFPKEEFGRRLSGKASSDAWGSCCLFTLMVHFVHTKCTTLLSFTALELHEG